MNCTVVRLAYIDKDVNEFKECFCVFIQKVIYLTNERQTCKSIIVHTNKGLKGLENYDYIDWEKNIRRNCNRKPSSFKGENKENRKIYLKRCGKRVCVFLKTESVAGTEGSV